LPFGGAFFAGVIKCGLSAVLGFVLIAGGDGFGDSICGVATGGASLLATFSAGRSFTTESVRG